MTLLDTRSLLTYYFYILTTTNLLLIINHLSPPIPFVQSHQVCSDAVNLRGEIPLAFLISDIAGSDLNKEVMASRDFFISLVNTKNDGFMDHILPNHKIVLHNGLSNCNPVLGFSLVLNTSDTVCGLLGPSCSSVVSVSSILSEMKQIPMVSAISTGILLTDPVQFPFFTRVIADDSFQGKVMLDVLQGLGVKRIGILYVEDTYGNSVKSALASEAPGKGVHVEFSKGYEDSLTETEFIQAIRTDLEEQEQKKKLVYYAGTFTQLRTQQLANIDIFLQAKGFVFVFAETSTFLLESGGVRPGAFKGAIGVSPGLVKTSFTVAYLSQWENADKNLVSCTYTSLCPFCF